MPALGASRAALGVQHRRRKLDRIERAGGDRHQHQGTAEFCVVSGLAIAIGLLAAACGPAHTAATGAATARGTAEPPSSASPPSSSTGDQGCDSVTTCYAPQQLQVAYGIKPLLERGIDGSGETVVLPELAEVRLNPPVVTDLRQDFAAYDRLFHLPAPRLKVVSTFPGPVHPGSPSGRRSWTPRWSTRSLLAPRSLSSWSKGRPWTAPARR